MCQLLLLIQATNSDIEILKVLEERKKDIIVVANKVDKIKPSMLIEQLKTIQETVGPHKVVPFSSNKKIGIKELQKELLG